MIQLAEIVGKLYILYLGATLFAGSIKKWITKKDQASRITAQTNEAWSKRAIRSLISEP